ncbi:MULTISPECIES: TetR/AcrR family transcriptional regulator [Streptomyces]|uniref:TetR family transcriptional regulator n=2 Tax=Streptomyces TaxID=1883 RepID=A0A2N8PGM0_STRNR|nr:MULTISPECIES: TetR family transcriptional regulator [Streptomyces]PNE40151.1 TetR family transcriptional regulator [Streptomyces noursei]SHL37686.1 transcriptional regulator, TetR family [Streptomyces yunnanensis]
MAWDTARTQQLLLDAAVEEFAEHGPEGARVARVATRAGINKERIYQYFGSKEKLFVAVLESELEKIAAAVPLTPEQAADLGDYAGRIFDYHRRHPHFVRLLAWEGLLCQDRVAAEGRRTDHYAEKIAVIAAAQKAGAVTDRVEAGQLMRAVIALTVSWFTLPQLARMLAPAVEQAGPDAERDALVALVRRLAT